MRLLLLSTAWVALLLTTASGQKLDFFAVGARYAAVADEAERRRDLEDMRQLQFNVVSLMGQPGGVALAHLDRVIAGAPFPGVAGAEGEKATIVVVGDAAEMRVAAWAAVARGARVVLFDDWSALERSPEALGAAADFAGAIVRNAALYASLRPRVPPGITHVSAPEQEIEARLLESHNALVLIVLNHTNTQREATIRFSPDIPEAIWRNLLTGTDVHFVTDAGGPSYSRSLGPKEAIVLVIDKR